MSEALQGSTRNLNTMAIDAQYPELVELSSIDDLEALTLGSSPFYILGEGSNTLFTQSQTPVLIRPLFKGIQVTEQQSCYELHIGAGENWHQLVDYTVKNSMPGLENLALIPGSVGAAPVQNIGAYGVEFSNYCQSVTWYDFASKTLRDIANSDCQFAYRDSIFKHQLKGKGLIVAVTLSLPKFWRPNLSYQGLDNLAENCSALDVMTKVIEIRNSKLPNPAELANAGSFFKNPVVSKEKYLALAKTYPSLPNYPQPDGSVKLAAGWLIEQAGLKGYRSGDAGVHNKQALVLVNFANASGQDMFNLAQQVIDRVQAKFALQLEPEVRLVSALGESSMSELLTDV